MVTYYVLLPNRYIDYQEQLLHLHWWVEGGERRYFALDSRKIVRKWSLYAGAGGQTADWDPWPTEDLSRASTGNSGPYIHL